MFKNINELLKVFPVIAFMAFMNVFICFSAAWVVLNLIISCGYNKYIAYALSIITVFIIYLYMFLYQKIRDYIKRG